MSASSTNKTVDDALISLARTDRPRVLSILAYRLGDLDLADDAVQDAFIDAMRSWPTNGVPENPGAWLMSVAKRRAQDRLRAKASANRRDEAAGREQQRGDDAPEDPNPLIDTDDTTMPDERLRLIFLCCHPALDPDSQIALTLRLVGGLTTPEIAAAFLTPEPTLAQRIVRAKRKIRDANIPLNIPSNLDERLDVVLSVLYLVFNEGYLSRSEDKGGVRLDLIRESGRLVELLATLLPDNAEIDGLRAMQLFAIARLATRFDDDGDLVLLEDQDRGQWDLAVITSANACLARAMARRHPGPYQVQALIASHHANARTAADTDWPMIVRLYGQLEAMTGSPVVRLNRAVAVSMADGPNAGLKVLDTIEGLDRYHLFHAARGELLSRCGRERDARTAFDLAESLASNPAEKRHLNRRARALAD
jgi:RNA polymerase sigma-70 factor, ECF subfamily